MNTVNWNKTLDKYQEVQQKSKGKRFLHMRFELPYTAPSLTKDFVNSDDVLCVDLDSALAKVIFGQNFIDKWNAFLGKPEKSSHAAHK